MALGRQSVDEKNRTENGAAADLIDQIQQSLFGATIQNMSARRKA